MFHNLVRTEAHRENSDFPIGLSTPAPIGRITNLLKKINSYLLKFFLK